MKNKLAYTIAALLIAAMLATVTVNCFYVKNTAEYIIDSLEEISNDASPAFSKIQEVAEYWEDRRAFLSFTFSEPELDEISSIFDELMISIKEENSEEYKKSMAHLKRAIENIMKLEEFSIENIF